MKGPAIKTAYFAAFLAIAAYAFFALRGPHGIPALLEKQHEIHDMEEKNAKLDREIERMRDQIKRLENNPSEQELEVRQRLRLLKPGEKEFVTGKAKQ
jgi:cell division protein FtsB